MDKLSQNSAPVMEALQQFRRMRVVPFDVPGHKRGKGNPELTEFLGERCLSVDVNSMKPLDNLCHPVSVIEQAEALAAEAFGAAWVFFMVGGTTSSVQAMILSSCQKGDKIILPRNVHRSAINALILSGAVPVYINPEFDEKLEISLGITTAQVEKAIRENPDAKALFINNPTYYGICSDLAAITTLAHKHSLKVLVDEAHGTHFYFGKNLPISAMAAGSDMAAVSMHKSGGSLTQSSFLLLGDTVDKDYVRQIINLTQSTSASYLLLASLDISRKRLALQGKEIFAKVCEMTEYAREEINQISGFYAYGNELKNCGTVFDFDITKLAVNTSGTGLTGIEVYDILRDEYDIQVEFGDIGNILAYVSVGDCYKDLERLVSALSEINRKFKKDRQSFCYNEFIIPHVALSPQEAFYAEKVSVPLGNSPGRISGEFVMCYPPGIPILAPGEEINSEIVELIRYSKDKGCSLTGTEDIEVKSLKVLKGE